MCAFIDMKWNTWNYYWFSINIPAKSELQWQHESLYRLVVDHFGHEFRMFAIFLSLMSSVWFDWKWSVCVRVSVCVYLCVCSRLIWAYCSSDVHVEMDVCKESLAKIDDWGNREEWLSNLATTRTGFRLIFHELFLLQFLTREAVINLVNFPENSFHSIRIQVYRSFTSWPSGTWTPHQTLCGFEGASKCHPPSW